jgi:hypothetical protein
MGKCYKPVNIRDPANINSKSYVLLPCGKCMNCLENRRREWAFRMSQELRDCVGSCFVTLTYSEENLEGFSLKIRDVQLFMKKFRKMFKQKIKYYAVGEYGSKSFRPHYHFIGFNTGLDLNEVNLKVLKAWNKGIVHVGDVSPGSILYVAKYLIQNDVNFDGLDIQKPFSLMSKNLGFGYIKKMENWHNESLERNFVTVDGGVKLPMPRYYKSRIYSKITLETLKLKNDNYRKVMESQMGEESLPLSHKRDAIEAIERRVKKSIKFNAKI